MKKIIKITESELTNLIHQIVTERRRPRKDRALGTPCTSDAQCASDEYCGIGGDGVNGLCRAKDLLRVPSGGTAPKNNAVKESHGKKRRIQEIEGTENFFNPQALDTADAIYTIIATTVGMLGIAGYDVLKGYAKELMKAGKKKEAKEMMSAIKDMQSNDNGGEIEEDVPCGNKRKYCNGRCIQWNAYCGERWERL